ncbi:hypothetical protein Fcan01_11872 [Folsomia candida]|uniref:Uncharacterized protein n=1 Tax=Folsomia candida TaxID=158441 RepID=A0A226EA22_FOLCA|nr:hypothetical protein Fcan01_11872 [Folsomia candida]
MSLYECGCAHRHRVIYSWALLKHNSATMNSVMLSDRPNLEDFLALAHPNSNVVILEENAGIAKYDAVYNELEHHFWDFTDELDDDDELEPNHDLLGPECCLRGQEIWDIDSPLTHNGTLYCRF